MTTEERRQQAADRAGLVAAVREHSVAVARHLDRVSDRLRAQRRSTTDEQAPAMQGFSTLLLAEASIEGLLQTVLHLARRAVDACDAASVTLVQNGHLDIAAVTHPDVTESDRFQYDLGEGPCYDAVTSGGTVIADNLPDPRWPRFAECAVSFGWGGIMSVPLVTRAGLVGVLNLYARRRDVLGRADLPVAQALADQAAVALTNARDFREQQAATASFQRFLLPAALPPVPGLALAARYRPASSGINVGGDWYDVLPLADGEVALVIGDVAGHGLGASVIMGQLRTAVRAYALEHQDPPDVIALTSAYLDAADPEGYATCCIILLDPRTGEARWADAGHPPPLLLEPGRRPVPLASAPTHPALGVRSPGPEPAGRRVLAPGARLLLYTDGLVERREEAIDVGLARLARVAARRNAGPGETGEADEADLEAWCDHILAELLDGREVGDDVAMLAVRLAPKVLG